MSLAAQKLTVGSLFAGIGGFDLGLERTGGFEIKWQVEIDEYCRRVLAKHWPNVKRYGDIREIQDVERVDVLCGGFPCQDISRANRNAVGIHGERSGLWFEYARLIRMVRPKWAVMENTPALLERGMGYVVGELAASGYCCEWDCLPASTFGADHIRDRIFIIAYPSDWEHKSIWWPTKPQAQVAKNATNIDASRLSRRCSHRANNADVARVFTRSGFAKRTEITFPRQWRKHSPLMGRGVHGIPRRVDRLKGLGNAVVPQVVEWIGRRILDYERSLTESTT